MNEIKVALADDEAIIRMDLCATLSQLGFKIVASVANGKALVEYCKKSCPDVIVTDITMPVMNGFDAIREIHSQKKVPVIFISGEPMAKDVAALFPEAICLTKPFRDEELSKNIVTLASKNSAS